MPLSPGRALLIDDHEIVRNAAATCLLSKGLIQDCAKASNLAEAECQLESGQSFVLIILDLHLADANGLDALEVLAERWPKLPKLVFSGDDSVDTMARAFELGALGFVAKTESMATFCAAVSSLLSGRPHLPDKLLAEKGLVRVPPVTPAFVPPALEGSGLPDGGVRLTARQLEVIAMVAQALPNKLIARRLSLSEGTVKSHLNTIFRIIGARNRLELLLRVQQIGLVLPALPDASGR